jgi:hypothetical protein
VAFVGSRRRDALAAVLKFGHATGADMDGSVAFQRGKPSEATRSEKLAARAK